MAISIKFDKSTNGDYLYSDLALDLEREYIPLGKDNLTRKSGGSDIKTDFDEYAIRNSLRNLFATRPRQRILNPDYGLNLTQFLFESANEFTARLITRKIFQGIQRYESRVTINLINVEVDEDNQKYFITINLTIPSISNRQIEYTGVFDESGFTL